MENQGNPWQTLSSKIVYENPWIQVRHEDVISPKGTQGIYGVVSFKNNAIGIIPLDNEQNTWLVGQYRYSLNEYSWEIPMGGGLVGTSILEAAQRELREETGLSADKWTYLLRLHTSNSVTDEEGHAFLAEGLTEGETDFDETEDLKIKKLPIKTAIEMVMNGQITDALTVAALLKVARLLHL